MLRDVERAMGQPVGPGQPVERLHGVQCAAGVEEGEKIFLEIRSDSGGNAEAYSDGHAAGVSRIAWAGPEMAVVRDSRFRTAALD